MERTRELVRILKGAAVFTTDGARVGTVTEANAGYFVVRQSGFATDYFIPTSAIARARGKRAELNASHADLLMSGWDRGQAIPM
jgi:hypothetical protein